jgi:hypothetical protein
MPAGFLFGGKLAEWCSDGSTGMTDYRAFFAIPAAIVIALLIFYCKAIGPNEPHNVESAEIATKNSTPTTFAGSD